MAKKFVPLVRKGEICKLFLESIILIEQDLRKTMFYTEDDIYWAYGKIDEWLKYLDGNFLKCNYSCVINLNKVIRMKGQMITFENGYTITIGRDTFQKAKQCFARHMLQASETANGAPQLRDPKERGADPRKRGR